MATDETDKDGGQDARCMPCDGRGKVISNLGGEAREVPCPWCDGTGTRVAQIDAQAHWLAEREREGAPGEAAAAGSDVQASARD